MEVLLVRHAHAGAKERWRGDDRLRPLSSKGRRQASALVAMLAPARPCRILSSPLARCRETVEPLSSRLSVGIEETDRLAPDATTAALDLLVELAAGQGAVVACTHGETIASLQRLLPVPLGFGADDAREKGSVWVLEATGGRFTTATYIPPGGDLLSLSRGPGGS